MAAILAQPQVQQRDVSEGGYHLMSAVAKERTRPLTRRSIARADPLCFVDHQELQAMLTINRLYGVTRAWQIAMWGGFLALLLAPLIAMQLTPEVQWTAFDFVAAAVLFAILGLSTELLVRSKRNLWIRVAGFAVCIGAALVISAHGAVGVF